ncbi:MATE family efflux transporter [Endozoicomonas ascidiicola]|uniref:MATE family efflux transporter n=1 Tax=Endozoicomonas ascidiicola TaxID=1698521 RepID=UPI000B1A0667|nr:MATE family efflux transporter [Endozoicomonas ascidiicola]
MVSSEFWFTALFVVDMLDLFFLSLLGEKFLAAAVGYASTVLFVTTSIGIGLSIATGALLSKSIGARERDRACQFLANTGILGALSTSVIALVVWMCIPELLDLVGAQGEVHALAVQYLNIMIPSMPVLAIGMCFGAALRAVGDAKRSMASTLAGGAVNAVLDPVFIFMLNMDIEGAAIASVCARVTIFCTSAYGVIKVHQLLRRVNLQQFYRDIGDILRIAIPAILTNLAMPISSVLVMREISGFGDGIVAGYAIIGRITPVAFGVVFALSGAIGPIVGQNYGALLIDRVKQSLKNAYLFSTVYITVVSMIVFLVQDSLVVLFSTKGEASQMIHFFCTWIAISFVFNGALFVANASFNNLGKPGWSTLFNWGKATIGTVPFIMVGGEMDGAFGVLSGQAIGGIVFSLLAVFFSFRLVDKVGQTVESEQGVAPASVEEEISIPCPLSPLASDSAHLV